MDDISALYKSLPVPTKEEHAKGAPENLTCRPGEMEEKVSRISGKHLAGSDHDQVTIGQIGQPRKLPSAKPAPVPTVPDEKNFNTGLMTGSPSAKVVGDCTGILQIEQHSGSVDGTSLEGLSEDHVRAVVVDEGSRCGMHSNLVLMAVLI